MNLIPIDTRVQIGKIVANITEIKIYGNNAVDYKCTWWDGNKLESEFIRETQLETKEEDRIDIQFGECLET